MPRHADWEQRLYNYLSEDGRDCFVWGVNDCALFACGAVQAMTGEHPAPQFLEPPYDDALTAATALRERGQGTLKKTFSHYFETVPPGYARRGDLVMARDAIGICNGIGGVFLQQDAGGYAILPRSEFEVAWRVD